MNKQPKLSGAKPLPRRGGPEEPFWEGLNRGEIRVQQCQCGHLRFPSSRYCPACHGDKYSWRKVDPVGEVESFCTFHKAYFAGFAEDVPYTVIQVRLDSGVKFFSNMTNGKQEVEIGQRVSAVFERVSPDVTLLKFKPI